MAERKKTSRKPGKTTKEANTQAAQLVNNEKSLLFPIIGLGASAGGLDALKRFFSHISEKSNLAYIVVVHMSRSQPSMLVDLLQRSTSIPVLTAVDGHTIKPDHVYINPPNKELIVHDGTIQLYELLPRQPPHIIDSLFKSLAIDQGDNGVGIVMSGTGTDGTLGLKEIKACGGLTLAQDEASAEYAGMPRSAIKMGVVDKELTPEMMPQTLLSYFKGPGADRGREKTPSDKDKTAWLNKILSILRTRTGHDFSLYKDSTTIRRIDRHMALNQIDRHETYIRYLRENPAETDILFQQLLIGVTSFFRESESLEALETIVLPKVIEHMKDGDSFRAWVPACSTGEEVYTLAIILNECAAAAAKEIKIQLFGTDINSNAIEHARKGIYPASIAGEIQKHLLAKYFLKKGDTYHVKKNIRDCAIFSSQDVLQDPPFSRLNLLCCRNLLIYLTAEAQKNLVPLFHYTLKQDCLLVLGSSETIGSFSNLFDPVVKKHKIYRRRDVLPAVRPMVNFPSGTPYSTTNNLAPPADGAKIRSDFAEITRQLVLDAYSPTAILIESRGQILHIQGRSGRYLEPPQGPPTNNIIDQARNGLRIELSSAIRQAKTSGKAVTRHRVMIQDDRETHIINLHVCPQSGSKSTAGCYLVVFENVESISIDAQAAKKSLDDNQVNPDRISELEKELLTVRESHQCTIEELESSNEELKSTNEELQSANEELQSTNEELESSKEELQSLNEELQTVNSEMQSKVEELSSTHDDMRNLLNSIEVATIFVGNDMALKRFSRETTKIINFIQSDIGRPIAQVSSNLKYSGLTADLEEVLNTLTTQEKEVQTTGGQWYMMRIIPYRTLDNRIDGAIITFSNITPQKKAQQVLETAIASSQSSQVLVRNIFDMNRQPLAVLDPTGTVVIANTALTKLFDISQENIEGTPLTELKAIEAVSKTITEELNHGLQKRRSFTTAPIAIQYKGEDTLFSIQGRVIRQDDGSLYRCLIRFIKKRRKAGSDDGAKKTL